MKILPRILLLAALAGIGYWLWAALFPGDEAVVRKRVNRITTLMTFDSKEGNFARLAKVEELENLFAPELEIVLDAMGDSIPMVNGRAELRQQAFFARSAVSSMTVRFLDSSVTLSADKNEAVVNLTVEVETRGGARSRASDQEQHVQELKFQLRKSEGTWLIVRVETVRTLT